MKKISVSNCEAGMILKKAIFYSGSAVLLQEGIELTEAYIKNLKNLGITEIYVEEQILSNCSKCYDVSEQDTKQNAINSIKKRVSEYISQDIQYCEDVKNILDKIVNDILSLDYVQEKLMDIELCDSYTYSHSVNVCILSIITGVSLGLSILELKELGIGALLHDIGKIMIPPKVLQKKSSLSDEEFEIIKQHSAIGYDILKSTPQISEISAKVALSHHERYDGKGYLRGLKNDEIHLYSRIVAIVDIFDALTSDRVYRKKISTYSAINYLTTIAAPSLDENVLLCFAKIIAPFIGGMRNGGRNEALDSKEEEIV